MNYNMVIDILNDNVIQGLPFDKSDNSFQKNHDNSAKVISLNISYHNLPWILNNLLLLRL